MIPEADKNDQNPWKDILTDKRKLFVVFSIVVPFIVYCVYYYSSLIHHAPFRYDQFKKIEYRTFRYGKPRTVINSETGEFTYYNRKDSLIHTHIVLSPAAMKDIHEKMRDILFWDIPLLAGDSTQKHRNDVPLVYIKVDYLRASKRVWWQKNYFADLTLDGRMGEITKFIDAKANEALSSTTHEVQKTR